MIETTVPDACTTCRMASMRRIRHLEASTKSMVSCHFPAPPMENTLFQECFNSGSGVLRVLRLVLLRVGRGDRKAIHHDQAAAHILRGRTEARVELPSGGAARWFSVRLADVKK